MGRKGIGRDEKKRGVGTGNVLGDEGKLGQFGNNRKMRSEKIIK
jgi:hypothetical protein